MNTKTNKLLTIVVVLQGLILAGQWLGNNYVSTAHAQVPDGGAQRQAMVDEQRSTNSKLDRLNAFLESGKLQVKTVSSDEKR